MGKGEEYEESGVQFHARKKAPTIKQLLTWLDYNEKPVIYKRRKRKLLHGVFYQVRPESSLSMLENFKNISSMEGDQMKQDILKVFFLGLVNG